MEGKLSNIEVEFDEDSTCVGVCLVSGGYPGSYPKNKEITGI